MTPPGSTTRPAVDSVIGAVGNTPVVKLNRLPGSSSAAVHVKLEGLNPTGSYKDRMALAMIEEAERRGDLRPGMTVVEYTGGSTGSALAFVCAAKGYRFRVVCSDAFSQEKLDTMRALGAELEVIPSHGRGITRELIESMIERAGEMARAPGTYFTDQFNNRDAHVGYRKVGSELLDQLPNGIDVFCAAVGTAGLTMGVSQAFRARGSQTRVVVLEPAESPVLSTGVAGSHHVEGIGAGFRPPLFDDALYDEIRTVPEERAKEVARRLAADEGVFVGWSSGVNVSAALDIAAELGPGHTVATVAVDSGLKYLAGELFR